MAKAAAGDVIDDDAVPLLEAFQMAAFLNNNAAGLMAGNGSWLIALGPLAHMGPVDAADIAAADR